MSGGDASEREARVSGSFVGRRRSAERPGSALARCGRRRGKGGGLGWARTVGHLGGDFVLVHHGGLEGRDGEVGRVSDRAGFDRGHRGPGARWRCAESKLKQTLRALAGGARTFARVNSESSSTSLPLSDIVSACVLCLVRPCESDRAA